MSHAAIKNDTPLVIPTPPAGEEDRVAGVLSAIEEHVGFVPDGLRLYSFSPPLLESFVGYISYFSSGERLSPTLLTMVRYLVSWQNECSFCIDMNEGFLVNMGVDIDAVRAARTNPDAAPVADKEKPLLKLALKAVNTPEDVNQTDLQAVHAQGWSDRDIFDAVVQAANNRAFNTVLKTFNVEQQGMFA